MDTTPARMTRTSGVRKTYDKLGLALSSSKQVLFCKCPQLCSDYQSHPFGRLFKGEKADGHYFERAEAELKGLNKDFTYPATKELIKGYRDEADAFNKQPKVLVAQGQTACSNRTECYITPLHFAKHQDGVCVLHAKQPALCQRMSLSNKGESSTPFANLSSWTPEARPFGFGFHYQWQTRKLATPAIQSTSSSPLHTSSTARSHNSPTPFPRISSITSPAPSSSASVETSRTTSAPPTPNRLSSSSSEHDLPPLVPLDPDLQQSLDRQAAEVNQKAQRKVAALTTQARREQLARNEAKAKAEAKREAARKFMDQRKAEARDWQEADDPVVAKRKFRSWLRAQGAEPMEGSEDEGEGEGVAAANGGGRAG